METPRVRLGELLVRAGLVTNEQLEEALIEQRRVGKRLGSLLVDSGLVSETQVTQILSQQLSVPWVSLHHIDFSRDLLKLVPVDVVERFCLIPIYVRRVRGLGDALYVAMDDPTNGQALSAVAERSGLHVRAMIAPPSDIRAAILVYYGVGAAPAPAPVAPPQTAVPPQTVTPVAPPDRHSEPGERPDQAERAKAGAEEDEDVPTGVHSRQGLFAGAAAAAAAGAQTSGVVAAPAPVAPAPQPIAAPVPVPASSPRASAPPVPASSPRASAPPRAAVEGTAPESRPRPRFDSAPPSSRGTRDFMTGKAAGERAVTAPQKPGARKMIALTLLDGTTISVPAKEKRGGATVEEPPEEVRAAPSATEPGGEQQLTARDIVAALRAAARGVDASEIIGENARWEAMFAALLSALLKKHLITDREFIEEFKKS